MNDSRNHIPQAWDTRKPKGIPAQAKSHLLDSLKASSEASLTTKRTSIMLEFLDLGTMEQSLTFPLNLAQQGDRAAKNLAISAVYDRLGIVARSLLREERRPLLMLLVDQYTLFGRQIAKSICVRSSHGF